MGYIRAQRARKPGGRCPRRDSVLDGMGYIYWQLPHQNPEHSSEPEPPVQVSKNRLGSSIPASCDGHCRYMASTISCCWLALFRLESPQAGTSAAW